MSSPPDSTDAENADPPRRLVTHPRSSQVPIGDESGGEPDELPVVHLLREGAAKDRLEDLLLKGLNSGPPIEADEAFWEDLRREVEAKLAGAIDP